MIEQPTLSIFIIFFILLKMASEECQRGGCSDRLRNAMSLGQLLRGFADYEKNSLVLFVP